MPVPPLDRRFIAEVRSRVDSNFDGDGSKHDHSVRCDRVTDESGRVKQFDGEKVDVALMFGSRWRMIWWVFALWFVAILRRPPMNLAACVAAKAPEPPMPLP